MSNLSSNVQGSCLCGSVNLSTQIKREVSACHCNICRKWGGAALLGVECESDVSFSGEKNIGVYQSSPWAERGFCKKCGTHLFYRLKEKQHYYIPVGVFDNAKDLVFTYQAFIEQKPEYYSFINQTRNITGEELFALLNSSSE